MLGQKREDVRNSNVWAKEKKNTRNISSLWTFKAFKMSYIEDFLKSE
jgi:hypothetical protein